MIEIVCLICSKTFLVKPSQRRYGWGQYCSGKCRGLAQRKGRLVDCHTCGKKVWRKPQALKRSKSNYFFCSKSCQTLWRNSQVYIGSSHPNWKGGKASYRDRMKQSSNKAACCLCQTTDSRVLAVHHIDENRGNNSIANLAWLCHNCHFLVHHYDDEKQSFMAVVAQ
jgi:hypothetical protein